MREYSHVVRIERHVLPPDIAALTFSAEGRTEAPLVFVLHGLGSRKERHLDLCLRLADAGFTACALDAACHGERQSDEACAGLNSPRETEAFTIAFLASIQQTIQDVMAVADDLRASRYGVVGHSMGGHTAMLLAAADTRAAAVVNVSGSIFMSEQFATALRFSAATITALRSGDPVLKAEAYAPRPILLLHGADDATVPFDGAKRLHNALIRFYEAAPERCDLTEMPGVGHAWTPEMAEQSVAWLERHLF